MNLFAGFGKLGYVCLKELQKNGVKLDFVLTHKDGSENSVDEFSSKNNIAYSYSDLRKDQSLLNLLKEKRIQFLFSVNYRFILPDILLQSSEYPLNMHGSLLPKYRGRTPHVWAIINGEEQTGITCHIMEKTVDTGDIYHQEIIEIEADDTGASILEKYEKKYPQCLMIALKKISEGFRPEPQNQEQASYFGKRNPEMGYIDFTKTNDSIINFIRAQARPYPGAYCYLPTGRKLIVHRAVNFNEIWNTKLSLGNLQEYKEGYIARTREGFLYFLDFEIE